MGVLDGIGKLLKSKTPYKFPIIVTVLLIVGVLGVGSMSETYFLSVLIIGGLLIIIVPFLYHNQNSQPRGKITLQKKKRNPSLVWLLLMGLIMIVLMVNYLIMNRKLKLDTGDSLFLDTIYHENFDSNRFNHAWIEGEQQMAKSYFSRGAYHLNSKDGFISRRLDLKKDFALVLDSVNAYKITITFSIEPREAKSSEGGLEWGANSRESLTYSFRVKQNMSCVVGVYQYTNEIERVATIQDCIQSLEEQNELTVLKARDSLFFSINGRALFKEVAPEEFGNEVGFGVSSFSNMQVDELVVLVVE